MKITEIRMNLCNDPDSQVAAFCTVSLDHQLAIHDLRIIRQADRLFVAMPNRKQELRCAGCRSKNYAPSNYCRHCGNPISAQKPTATSTTRNWFDIAHPLTTEFREELEQRIIENFLLVVAVQNPGFPLENLPLPERSGRSGQTA